MQGDPSGLLVVNVIVMVLPKSFSAGVYMNEKGEDEIFEILVLPAPLWDIDTAVALPPNVLPFTETGLVPQVVPEYLVRAIVGGFSQPQDTGKADPIVVHWEAFLTVIK